MSDLPVIEISPQSRAHAKTIVDEYLRILRSNPDFERRATIALILPEAMAKAGVELAARVRTSLGLDGQSCRPSARYHVPGDNAAPVCIAA